MARAARTRTPANNGVRDDPASAYDMTHADEGVEQRTLACIVDNEPGVLARVVGLFAARQGQVDRDIDRRSPRGLPIRTRQHDLSVQTFEAPAVFNEVDR